MGGQRSGDDGEAAIRSLADQLLPLFYDELHRLARKARRQVGPGITLQTTALVHEAYLKLRSARGWADDRHFLSAAAIAMRHALINHAQARMAGKRGGGAEHVPLGDGDEPAVEDDTQLLALNEALERLALVSPRLARLIECRYFAGYGEAETAHALGLSDRTVRRDWTLAKAWLYRALHER